MDFGCQKSWTRIFLIKKFSTKSPCSEESQLVLTETQSGQPPKKLLRGVQKSKITGIKESDKYNPISREGGR